MSEKFTIFWNEDLPLDIAVGDTLGFIVKGKDESYAVLAINEDGIVVKKLETLND